MQLNASESPATVTSVHGIATGYGLALALRNVGNGVAQVDLASFEVSGERVEGTPDRRIVPKGEAFRLVFEVNDRRAFQREVLDDGCLCIEVAYSDAARRMTGLTTVRVRLGAGREAGQWDAVVDKVCTSAS